MLTHEKPLQFILDCSVTMAWCFEDEITSYSEDILDSLKKHSAAVPNIWQLEVANVLLFAERKKRTSTAKSNAFRKVLHQLPIKIEHVSLSTTLDDILELGRETGLTAYDAAYLDLAIQKNLPLATLDKALRQAAVKIGVTLYKT